MPKPFAFIDFHTRSPKPRSQGLTMMVDFGYGVRYQEDLMNLAGEFIDLAKVAVGISGLLCEETLTSKLQTYRRAGVEPFPGGMFAELAHHQGKADQYLAECTRVGYSLVEISDNVVHFSADERQRLIRSAQEEHGLRVLAEVGSKKGKTEPDVLADDISASLKAGAWKVLVEAFEFVTPDGLDMSLIEQLLREVDADEVLFELPGKWLAEVHAHEVYQMMAGLVASIGPNVNIANVTADDVIAVETLRTGLGVTMSF